MTSLARPTGNVTGVVFQQLELSVKRLQLLKDALPDRQTATVFWDVRSATQWQAAQEAASSAGLRLAGVELRAQRYDYEHALHQVSPEYRKTLIVMASPYFFIDRHRLSDFAVRNSIVTMFTQREIVEAGGLLSYAPSIPGMYRRTAEYVDRIAQGAKPTDLPIEQPTRFELVINLKTARALGLDIPPTLLALADEVIE